MAGDPRRTGAILVIEDDSEVRELLEWSSRQKATERRQRRMEPPRLRCSLGVLSGLT